jgi:hypothetical protein
MSQNLVFKPIHGGYEAVSMFPEHHFRAGDLKVLI